MASPLLRYTGRLLFACIFLVSAVKKLKSFDLNTGGEAMHYMEPKMDAALERAAAWTGAPLPLTKAHYPNLLLTAILLELGGGLLFILDRSLGAVMLLLFLVAVTPVMHAFWDLPPGQEQQADMINAYKNAAMIGALLLYLGSRRG